jgi:hypothetical protein
LQDDLHIGAGFCRPPSPWKPCIPALVCAANDTIHPGDSIWALELRLLVMQMVHVLEYHHQPTIQFSAHHSIQYGTIQHRSLCNHRSVDCSTTMPAALRVSTVAPALHAPHCCLHQAHWAVPRAGCSSTQCRPRWLLKPSATCVSWTTTPGNLLQRQQGMTPLGVPLHLCRLRLRGP